MEEEVKEEQENKSPTQEDPNGALPTEDVDVATVEDTSEEEVAHPDEEVTAEKEKELSSIEIDELEKNLKKFEDFKKELNRQLTFYPTIAFSTEFFKLLEHITVIKRALKRPLNDSITNLKALLPEHLRKLDLDKEYLAIIEGQSYRSRSERKLIKCYMFISAARKMDAITRAKEQEELDQVEKQDTTEPTQQETEPITTETVENEKAEQEEDA